MLVISQAIPVFALAPVLVLWLGYGMASKVAMASLIIFFPVATSFYDGLRRTEPGWLDLARTMNASRWSALRRVRIPAALPSLASGLRVAAAVAPIGAVVGEWVGSSAGLGHLMLHANARLQVDLMFAALGTLALMALALYFAVDQALRARFPGFPKLPSNPREDDHETYCNQLLRYPIYCTDYQRETRFGCGRAHGDSRLVRQSGSRALNRRPRGGLFSEVGLEVELIAPANPNDPPKLVAAGKADLAISYQPQLHLQGGPGPAADADRDRGRKPLDDPDRSAGGPIAKLADLKGRRIGYSVAFYKDLLLPAMLARHGLTLEDVDTVAVSFALSQSLLAGRVDATIGAFRNFELNQMALVGQEGRAFFPEEEGVPAYDELIVVANTASLGDSRLPGFLEALERGVLYLVNHPEESWRLFIGANPALDDELNRRAWRDTLPRFALRPAALDGHRYDRFARFLHARIDRARTTGRGLRARRALSGSRRAPLRRSDRRFRQSELSGKPSPGRARAWIAPAMGRDVPWRNPKPHGG